MTQLTINIGATANDGTGDSIRTAFDKVNTNFSEIYAKSAAGSNINISDNEILASNTNGGIDIIPSGSGSIRVVDDHIVIQTSHTPATSLGAVGDVSGSIAWDSNYFYVCIANYDGVTHIWKRASIATW